MEIIIHNSLYTIALEPIQSITYYQNHLEPSICTQPFKTFKNKNRLQEHLSVLYIIWKITGIQQNYVFDEYGKPICKITSHRLSISHSDNYSVVMFSNNCLLGIDIEEKERKLEKAAPKFINETEKQWVKDNLDLIKIWTAKEAIYKMIPHASPDFKNHYFIFEDNTALIKKPYEKKLTLNTYQTENYFITWTFETI